MGHGKVEHPPDTTVIKLLDTAWANISSNTEKFVFKSQDCKVFGGNLTSEGYKLDPKKIKPSQKWNQTRIFKIFWAT